MNVSKYTTAELCDNRIVWLDAMLAKQAEVLAEFKASSPAAIEIEKKIANFQQQKTALERRKNALLQNEFNLN